MPNFLIIGAAKSGTTSLYNYIQQHPAVYMSSNKEPRFFAFEGKRPDFRGPGDDPVAYKGVVTDMESYKQLFAGVSGEVAIGEASTHYLYNPEVPAKIRRHLPEVRLIAMLRDPVERAYSSFMHKRREGFEPHTDFETALQEEPSRIRGNWALLWHYKSMGFYYEQVKRYFELFDREQIRIYLYEDFRSDPLSVTRDIFRHLGVDESFKPDMAIKHNAGGVPISRLLQRFLNSRNPVKRMVRPLLSEDMAHRIADKIRRRNLRKPDIDPGLRARLIEDYREDILKLQDLLQKDLSAWLR